MSNSAYEYGKKMEQAGPRARAVSASLGLKTGDLTVLSNHPRSGDSEDSNARLVQAELMEQGASGRYRVTAAGNAALHLASAADRLDTAEDMVDPAVHEWARPKIQEAWQNFDQKQAAFDAVRRHGR